MKQIILILFLAIAGCKKSSQLTGKTEKGDLKSPCVSTDEGPCSSKFNPNAAHPELRPFIV